MNSKKFYIVSEDIIPEIFIKVVNAKELINSNQVSSITEAVNKIGLSRSTYYKYSDHVFLLEDGSLGSKSTINLILKHESGILSRILDIVAEYNGNILTITQNPPERGFANVSIHFDISTLNQPYNLLLESIKTLSGVEQLTLINLE
ncbi:MAG: ACT domain-containing protein [Clostridiales bacterium]|nr:ACT domain-containing protein [Clostridiales bacterium]